MSTQTGNPAARSALEALVATPSKEALTAFVRASLDGVLVVDVTGSAPNGTLRTRTIQSTDGRLVLPLFTSANELRKAVPPPQWRRMKATMLPGADAFALLETADFVAIQIDAGTLAQVVARPLLDAVLSDLQEQ